MNFKLIPIASLSLLLLAGCGDIEIAGSGLDANIGNQAAGPAITDVTPARTSIAGGGTITITGSGFSDSPVVILGNERLAAITVNGDTEITFEAPASSTPEVPIDLQVFTENGFALREDALTYNRPPTVVSSKPPASGLAGGGTLTIKGTLFQTNNEGTPTVRVGDATATSVEVVDDETIRATIPAGTIDKVAVSQDIIVSTSNGDVMLPQALTYVRAGFLMGTSRSQEQTGVYYLDPETGRSSLLIATNNSVSKLIRDVAGVVTVRFGNRGIAPFGNRVLGQIDFDEGVINPTTSTKLATNQQNVRLKSLGQSGGTVFGLTDFTGETGTCCDNIFGSVDLANGEFTTIAQIAGARQSSCLLPGPSNTLVFIQRFNEPIRSINTTTGVVSNLGTMSGDLLPGNDVRCHGADLFNGSIHAIQFDQATLKATLVTIQVTTGVVTFVADLPDGASGLVASPEL